MIKKILKSFIFNLLLMVGLTALVFYFTIKDDYRTILELLSNITIFSIIGLAVYIFLYQVFVGLILYVLTKPSNSNYKYRYGLINALIATFFHEIVPGAGGGQFMQVYVFKKHQVDLSDSASILWIDFILYQATMVISVLVLMLTKIRFIYDYNFNLFILVIVGFLVNGSIIVGMWLVTEFSGVYKWVSTKGIKIASKIKLVKDKEATILKMDAIIEKFESETLKMKQRKGLIFKVVLLNVVRLFIYYSFPIVCAWALNITLQPMQMYEMIVMTACVSSTASLFLVPGASGGTELSFVALFSIIMPLVEAKSVMLLWRIFSYYFMVVVSGVSFLAFKQYYKRREKL